jgi:hypothetical protein
MRHANELRASIEPPAALLAAVDAGIERAQAAGQPSVTVDYATDVTDAEISALLALLKAHGYQASAVRRNEPDPSDPIDVDVLQDDPTDSPEQAQAEGRALRKIATTLRQGRVKFASLGVSVSW